MEAPAPKNANGHSNTNAVLIANIPKVFHNDNIANMAQGAEPPVSPLQGTLSPVIPLLAYGTQVCVPHPQRQWGTVVPYYKYMLALGRSVSPFLMSLSTTSRLTV